MAISLEATPASSARAFSSTFSSSTTAPAAGDGRRPWAARSPGRRPRGRPGPRAMAASSSGPNREPAKPLGTERSRFRPSASVGAWVAISSIASSLRMRPRGWSRVWAVRSRQAATALNTARYLARVPAGLQPLPGVLRLDVVDAPDRSGRPSRRSTQARRPSFSSRSRSIGIERRPGGSRRPGRRSSWASAERPARPVGEAAATCRGRSSASGAPGRHRRSARRSPPPCRRSGCRTAAWAWRRGC